MRLHLCAAAACLLTSLSPLYAGHEVIESSDKKTTVPCEDFPFQAGTKEISIGGAAFGSISTHNTPTKPDAGYAIGELRLGIMVTTPHSTGILRGNLELMLEAFGGGIFDGPGDQLYGGQLLIRYNFVQPCARLVPFIQVGGGGVWSDAAYDDPIQREIGRRWSFNLSAEIGGRIMLSRNTSLNVGLEYRHISNADTADRNVGLNALGGELSFSCFF